MSLLSHNELLELVERGVITNVTPDMVNSSSIDLTLGDVVMVENTHGRLSGSGRAISIKQREPLDLKKVGICTPFYLEPGQFILAQSKQVFNLPLDISAEYKLKSSLARSGLEHLNAGWCDAGWNGSVLTLELKNMTQNHIIVLEKDIPIGQMVFFSHLAVPADKSYAARGRYNGDKTVKGIKE